MGLTRKQMNQLLPQWVASAENRQSEQGKANLAVLGATADEDRAQGDRNARLAELLKGADLESQAIEQNTQRARDEAARNGMKPGKYGISANKSGYSLTPQDELAALLKGQAASGLAEDRARRGVERYGAKRQQADIPARTADFAAVEAVTKSDTGGGILTNPNYEPKSAGTIINAVPNFLMGPAVAIGEKAGLLEKGAAAERRALQKIMNMDIKRISGASVTAFEEARNKIAQGQSMGGDPSLVRDGMVEALNVLKAEERNIDASFASDIKERYRAEGGDHGVDAVIGGSGELAGGQPSQPVFNSDTDESDGEVDDAGAEANYQDALRRQGRGGITVKVRNARGETHILSNPTHEDLAEAQADGFQVVR